MIDFEKLQQDIKEYLIKYSTDVDDDLIYDIMQIIKKAFNE